eukprot:TRINITY_DN10839_c0_g2_i3.p1 TRINITY_DN10839_c0_g2~~TRINITY_DN10839_c0_g2_i3.p1  ORF type:complete len:320 (-),score=41.69 TRINITY_DN10839_c0_g2_i3:600-1493(-)
MQQKLISNSYNRCSSIRQQRFKLNKSFILYGTKLRVQSKIGFSTKIRCQQQADKEPSSISQQQNDLQEEQEQEEPILKEKRVEVGKDDFYAEQLRQQLKSKDTVFQQEDDPLKLPLTGIKLKNLPKSLKDDDTISLGKLVEQVENSKSKRRTMLIGFTCDRCTGRSWRMVNPWAFSRGLVYVQCYYCKSWHKLVDNISLVEEIHFVHDDDVDDTQNMIVRSSQKIKEEIESKFEEDVIRWTEEMEKKQREETEGEEQEDEEEPLIVGQFVGQQNLEEMEEEIEEEPEKEEGSQKEGK